MGRKKREVVKNEEGLRRITTKEELIKAIEEHIDGLRKGAGAEEKKSVKSHIAFLGFADRFLTMVRKREFPADLNEGWELMFEITEQAAIVVLQLVGTSKLAKKLYKKEVPTILDAYVLIRIEPRMLTVEDYAQLHEVNVGTVRQWIRRGKIRSAQKLGNEWRIPEFVEPAGGKYRDGIFMWNDHLTSLPEGYEYLNEYCCAAISQIDKDTYKMGLQHATDSRSNRLVILNSRERECLELALISNPLVRSMDGSMNFELFEENLKGE